MVIVYIIHTEYRLWNCILLVVKRNHDIYMTPQHQLLLGSMMGFFRRLSPWCWLILREKLKGSSCYPYHGMFGKKLSQLFRKKGGENCCCFYLPFSLPSSSLKAVSKNYFFSNKVTKRAFLVFCYLLAGYPHHVCPYYGFSKKWPYRLAHWHRQASTKGESCSSTERVLCKYGTSQTQIQQVENTNRAHHEHEYWMWHITNTS